MGQWTSFVRVLIGRARGQEPVVVSQHPFEAEPFREVRKLEHLLGLRIVDVQPIFHRFSQQPALIVAST